MDEVIFRKYLKISKDSSSRINFTSVAGQWIGHFTYGPEYGEEIYGEKVQFKFFLEDLGNGQFKGTGVDIQGFGANLDTANIKGFLTDNFISFTKEYLEHFHIDKKETTIEDRSKNQRPHLNYSGNFDTTSKSFSGQWELWANEELAVEDSIVDVFTGTWEMTKGQE